MTQRIKIGAYAVLLCLGIWFGYGFFKHLSAATTQEGSAPVEPTNQVSQVDTNQDPATSEAVTNQATNAVANTNVAAVPPKQNPPKQASAPAQTRGKNTSAVMSY